MITELFFLICNFGNTKKTYLGQIVIQNRNMISIFPKKFIHEIFNEMGFIMSIQMYHDEMHIKNRRFKQCQ